QCDSFDRPDRYRTLDTRITRVNRCGSAKTPAANSADVRDDYTWPDANGGNRRPAMEAHGRVDDIGVGPGLGTDVVLCSRRIFFVIPIWGSAFTGVDVQRSAIAVSGNRRFAVPPCQRSAPLSASTAAA